MDLVERGIILLFRNIKIIFLKHASLIVIYFYYLLIGKLLLITYQIYSYRLGTLSLLYFLGLLGHIVYYRILLKKIYKVISNVLLLSLLSYLVYRGINLKYFEALVVNLTTASELIYNSEKLDFRLIIEILIITVPVISFIVTALDKKGKGEFTIILFSIPTISAYYYGIPKERNIYLIFYIYLTALYFIINFYKKSEGKSLYKKIKFSAERNSVITFGLFLSLIVTSMGYLTVEIFGTQNLSDIVEKIERKLIKYEDRGKKSLYAISNSGFGNNKKLGGPVTLNKDIAFRVKSDKPYYLRGIVKDYYDGFKWIDSFNHYFLKGSRGILKPDENYIKYMLGYEVGEKIYDENTVLTSKSITIYPENLQSSTLFSPYNTFNMKLGRDYIGYTYERTFMLLNKLSPENYYTANFYESKNGIENFLNSKDNLFKIDYEVNSNAESDKAYYDNNIKKKYGAYLTIPNNISQETYDLVESITKDASTTQEKVWEIYNYLNSNYKYSLDVSEVPESTEFLHYFLFTEKKGYCTYFATAAVVFCRIAGIPARYTEGFRMDENKDSNGLYVVGNHRAHAWAEILISEKHSIWSILDPVPSQENELNEGYENIPQNNKIDQWMKEEDSEESLEGNENFKNFGENEYYNEQIIVTNRKVKVYSALKLLFFTLPLTLFACALCYIYLRIRKYKHLKYVILNSESIIPLYNYSKQRLELIGIKCTPSSSELEFIESIKDAELKNELSVVTELYSEEYYGEKKLHDFNRKVFYNFIERYVKERQHLMHYYYYKYLKM